MSSSSFVHALAGATGGAAAMALTYPLDQIRTLSQAGDTSDASEIVSLITKNPKNFYKGCVCVIETITISNFIYFYLLEISKKRFQSPLLSSTIAAVCNTIITEPLWKATMVIKTSTDHHPPSLPVVIHRIAKQDGLSSLWSGTRVSLYLVSNPIIQFTIYEMLKRGKNISPLKAFIFGAISKSIATVSTYPLQVAQTRLRIHSSKSTTILQILSDLYQRERLSGLYRGCHAKLFQTVLTAAFMFAFYERIVSIITTRKTRP